MEDLLAAVAGFIAEAFVEVLFEVVVGEILAALTRGTQRPFRKLNRLGPAYATAVFVIVGAAAGGFSVLILPHPLFHPSRFHGISLILSPLVTGWVMSEVGSFRRRRGRDRARIESFGYGFAFALAMALIRLLFVQ